VDTLGLILAHGVPSAGVQDRDAAPSILSKLRGNFGRLRVVWADGGYAGRLQKLMGKLLPHRGVRLEIVRKPPGTKGFSLLRKRWMVERTFAWLSANRRLSCHYENTAESAEALLQVAMMRLMVRRVAKASKVTF